MDNLLKYFNEEEILKLIDTNKDIKFADGDVMVKLIETLEKININGNMLKNVISSNPFYLTRDIEEVKSLFNTLNQYDIKNLNVIIDTYPLFLNYYDSDIIDFFELKLNEGLSKEDICEIIESEPYIIDEI